MANPNNLIPFQFKKGQSGNPNGRPSSKAAIDHAMTETGNGKEIAERLIDLMRHGKREQTRLKAACELRNWCFGAPAPDHALALGGTLSEVRGEVLRFSAAFGPSRGEAQDDTASTASDAATAINIDGIAHDDEEIIDTEPGENPVNR